MIRGSLVLEEGSARRVIHRSVRMKRRLQTRLGRDRCGPVARLRLRDRLQLAARAAGKVAAQPLAPTDVTKS